MSTGHKPHSVPWLITDIASFLVANPEEAKVSDALKLARGYLDLEEQLEAAQETGMEMVRALGNDAIHINARAVRAVEIWRDYLASNPASEPENVS